jgi:hypothetical protein
MSKFASKADYDAAVKANTTDHTTQELMTQLMDLADLYANAVAANVDDDAPNMHELEQVEEAARSDLAEALESALAAQPPAPALPLAPSDWGIDTLAGRKILVYKNCSVIEDEQAELVLRLLTAASTTGDAGAEPALFGVQNVDTGIVMVACHRTEQSAEKRAKANTSNYGAYKPVALYLAAPGNGEGS